MVILESKLESVKSAHICVSNVLLPISKYANDNFNENSRKEREAFIETLVASYFVELENHECMKVVMSRNFSPHT